jgi:hypothetical protein
MQRRRWRVASLAAARSMSNIEFEQRAACSTYVRQVVFDELKCGAAVTTGDSVYL